MKNDDLPEVLKIANPAGLEQTEKQAEKKPETADVLLDKVGFTELPEAKPKAKAKTPRRKSGRGRKSKAEQEKEAALTAMQEKYASLLDAGLAATVTALAQLAAKYLDDEKWLITDRAEATELGGIVRCYLDIRLPDLINTPEGTLILGLSGYVFRRL